MVKNIRKNSERKLYKIAHPDYKPDAKFNYYLWVDAKGKSAYDKGKEIPLTSIFRESVECRSEEQGGQK